MKSWAAEYSAVLLSARTVDTRFWDARGTETGAGNVAVEL